jgi:hypothetical protein
MASSATVRSSSSVAMRPVGLCGEFSRMSLVRGVIAAASAWRSMRKSGACIGTRTAVAPAMATAAAYES